MTDAPKSRCAFARASLRRRPWRGSVDSASAVSVEVHQGLAREVSLAIPAGLVVNQVNGATVADWTVKGGLLTVRLSIRSRPSSRSSCRVKAGFRRMATSPCRSCGCRRRNARRRRRDQRARRRRDRRAQMRGLEPADLGPRRYRRRSDRPRWCVPAAPAAGSDPRSLRSRYALHAASGSDRQRRGGALSRARGRRRVVAVEARYAVRNNQRSFLKVTLPDARRSGARRLPASPCGRAWPKDSAARWRNSARWRASSS